jgi:hypothetical protein
MFFKIIKLCNLQNVMHHTVFANFGPKILFPLPSGQTHGEDPYLTNITPHSQRHLQLMDDVFFS